MNEQTEPASAGRAADAVAVDDPAAAGFPRPGSGLSQNGLPLYRQLYLILRAGLDNGTWRVGDKLPTENELARDYGCSLITVRRALGDLAREHRVERRAAKGTFAIEPPTARSIDTITSFTDEMKQRGIDLKNTVVRFDTRPASPDAARMLRVPENSPVYFLERVRSSDGRPMILEAVEIPVHLAPGLDDFDPSTSSLYQRLATVYGLDLTHGEEFIEPSLPDSRQATLLGQAKTSPVLLLELVAYTADGTAVEYCRSVVRGDAARYRVNVSRPTQRPSPLPGSATDNSAKRSGKGSR
jgi:GntR family transcriptional regulator